MPCPRTDAWPGGQFGGALAASTVQSEQVGQYCTGATAAFQTAGDLANGVIDVQIDWGDGAGYHRRPCSRSRRRGGVAGAASGA